MHYRPLIVVAFALGLLTGEPSTAETHTSHDASWAVAPDGTEDESHSETLGDAHWTEHSVGEHSVGEHHGSEHHDGPHNDGPHNDGPHNDGPHNSGSHHASGSHHGDEHSDHSPHAGCRCHGGHHQGISTDPGHPAKPKCEKPGDADRGDCPPYRYSIPDCKRAGNPHRVAVWAKCAVTKKYSVGYVGGGSAFGRIRGRTTEEGTWGMDYNGLLGFSTVWLDYTRGLKNTGRKQGGEGAYRTDGEPAIVAKAKGLIHRGH